MTTQEQPQWKGRSEKVFEPGFIEYHKNGEVSYKKTGKNIENFIQSTLSSMVAGMLEKRGTYPLRWDYDHISREDIISVAQQFGVDINNNE